MQYKLVPYSYRKRVYQYYRPILYTQVNKDIIIMCPYIY